VGGTRARAWSVFVVLSEGEHDPPAITSRPACPPSTVWLLRPTTAVRTGQLPIPVGKLSRSGPAAPGTLLRPGFPPGVAGSRTSSGRTSSGRTQRAAPAEGHTYRGRHPQRGCLAADRYDDGVTTLPAFGPPAPLLGAADIRRLAAELDIRPTKTLGQNFVIDGNTIRRIVAAANLGENETILEVGPGLGSLTLGLLDAAERVVAVEIDPILAAKLPDTIARWRPDRAMALDVVLEDAMRVTNLPHPPTALVANLPYNVAVPVVLTLLERFPSLRHGLVMVQDEVADRLVAPPGSRIYGVPSVKAAWYSTMGKAGMVGMNVFWPAPKIASGLVRFMRREPPVTTATREQVFAVIDAAFAQRRKTLRAALAGWAGSPVLAEQALRAAGVDPTARGEVLDITAFARIAEARAEATDQPDGKQPGSN